MTLVRPATANDIASLESFDEWKEATPERIAAGQCAVAGEGETVLGYAVFDRSFFKEPFLAYLLVHPDHRRRGIGAALMEFVESKAGDDVLYISTGRKNHAMQELLDKRAYRVAGMVDLEGHIEMIFAKALGAAPKGP